MIDHLSFYATNYEASKRFYDVILPTLGYEQIMEMTASWDPEFPTRRLCAFGPPKKPCFWLIEVKEPSSPRHIAFAANDQRSVDAFHKAALGTGAKDNGAPGP